MKHIWSVLCLKSIVDIDTNSLALHDCIDELRVRLIKSKIKKDEKITVPANFELVHLLFDEDVNKDRKFEIKIELHDPKNKKISDFSGGFVFPKNKKRFRVRMKINGMPVTSKGTYIFKIKIKEQAQNEYHKVAEIPLDVKIEWK